MQVECAIERTRVAASSAMQELPANAKWRVRTADDVAAASLVRCAHRPGQRIAKNMKMSIVGT